MKRKTIRLGINLLILVLTIIIFLIIVEGMLRLKAPEKTTAMHPLSPCIKESNNPSLAYEFIPNTKCTFQGTEVVINSQGLRDNEHTVQKLSDTLRIIALGDSYTFGWGVELNESYPKLLESYLNKKSGQKYEVINFGMPSHNTMQEARLLEIKAINYNPDIVLIGYTSGDPECPWDFCSKDLKKATNKAYERKWAVPFNYKTKKFLLQRSYFLNFLSEKYNIFLYNLKIRRDYNYISVSLHKKDSPTWKSVQDSFEKISEVAKKNNSKVVLVIFPELNFISSSGYLHKDIHEQIAEEARKYNFYILDLEPYYAKFDPNSLMIDPEADSHPNAIANKIAADAIYEFIIKEEII